MGETPPERLAASFGCQSEHCAVLRVVATAWAGWRADRNERLALKELEVKSKRGTSEFEAIAKED